MVAPGQIIPGLAQILNHDPYHLAKYSKILLAASIRLSAILSFVLALNRLKIICRLTYPKFVHATFYVVAYVYVVNTGILVFTPWCGYLFKPGYYIGGYDFSKPYTWLLAKVNSVVVLTSYTATLAVYLIIIGYVIRKNSKMRKIKNHQREKIILYYAGCRFALDMTAIIVFYWFRHIHTGWSGMLLALVFLVNSIAVSPALYLSLYGWVRNEIEL
ncbi:hypothetical protein L596_025272 [Steinernema carpocapsae]|uniref:7TM GPCR serpentine receptor class x (Srx) domain-containing protein n=1 Tax=Steinernema carpocapsae TaxID=34508 RepID=A0A4U5M7A8_STECR|nr:hypothetical protein L596_025272 [Steinernema carpocapsae]